MYSTFFIGDAFMIYKKAMFQISYSFLGAKKLDSSNKWEVSVLTTMTGGYAGGSSTVFWEVMPDEELRVSGSIKGYITVDGFNKQKVREKAISAIKFRQIENDMVIIDLICHMV